MAFCGATCLAASASAAPRASVTAKRTTRHAAPAAVLRAAFKPAKTVRAQRSVRVMATAETTTQVEELNTKYGIAGAVEVKAGRGGLPTVTLKSKSGASAEVTLFGACVTSWKTASGDEVLYIRPDAVFDKSKPISGGIPHCWPQFGPGAIQLHGFARNVDWALAGSSADGKPQVTLELTESDYTKAMWPASFKVVYTVSLEGEELHTKMVVHNTGDKAFEFTGSLHTYFGVSDIEVAAVGGLKGVEYLDRVADAKHPSVHKELRTEVKFNGPMDSVYRGVQPTVHLDTGNGTVNITSANWPDCVLWTPWEAMPACFREFVCVENAQFNSVTVQPGQSWTATTQMVATADPLAKFCGDNPDAEECKVFDD